MRPLPLASSRPKADGPARYVDAAKGQDTADGSEASPWRSIAHAITKAGPGDTIYLRGGTYYEAVEVTQSGQAGKPITLRSYPGELATIDAGLREFYEDPAHAWEPYPGGAEGEYVSTKTYVEGGGFGNFGDSMIPFHRYITMADLRSSNEFARPDLGKRNNDPGGIYCGPGTFRDKDGHIHIRLAHTMLAGLGERAYMGETDPRKLALVIAQQPIGLSIHNARHISMQDIVVRGAQREAVMIADAQDIELDGMTLYGSGGALRTSKVDGLRLTNSALRGHGAPWHARFHHKYRAKAGYLVIANGTNFEFSHCELTDNHDFLQLYGVAEMRFHHNFVDNFNDDGLEPGPKRAHGHIFIYQNLISRCLSPFTAHGKKPVPVTSDPGSGVYIFRNIVDLRHGTYKSPPQSADPSGAYLDEPTELIAHDHGSPVHPNYYVYQNTFLMHSGPSRGYYAFTWGAHTQGTTRRVFNNLFVQMEGKTSLNFTALHAADDFQSDGNLFWSVQGGAQEAASGNLFAAFRKSALFDASKKQYASGWAAHDRFVDPKFVSLMIDSQTPAKLELQADSPAVGSGVSLPAEWEDPLRPSGGAAPDIGALPVGGSPLRVGVGGRVLADDGAGTK